jgi:hypothetical protein
MIALWRFKRRPIRTASLVLGCLARRSGEALRRPNGDRHHRDFKHSGMPLQEPLGTKEGMSSELSTRQLASSSTNTMEATDSVPRNAASLDQGKQSWKMTSTTHRPYITATLRFANPGTGTTWIIRAPSTPRFQHSPFHPLLLLHLHSIKPLLS